MFILMVSGCTKIGSGPLATPSPMDPTSSVPAPDATSAGVGSQGMATPTSQADNTTPATPNSAVDSPAMRSVLTLGPITIDTVDQLKCLQTLVGHRNRVFDLAFSANGAYLASSGLDNTIKLWDVRSGQEVQSFSTREVGMNGIAFSPDGNLLASADAIWDVQTQQVVHTLERGRDTPAAIAFSPDGSLLVIAVANQPIKLRDVKSGQVVRVFERQADNAVFSIAFSPDGLLIAASQHGGIVTLWDVKNGQIVDKLELGNDSGVHDVAFSPKSGILAAGGTDNTARLWDIETGQVIDTLWHRNGLMSLAFSPDGEILATAGVESVVRLWDVENAKMLQSLPHDDELMSVTFSPSGTLLASAGYDNQIYLWGILTSGQ
jgi:WD40 repeat protein